MDEYEVLDKMQELKGLQKRQEGIKLENSLLSEHLSRVVMSKGLQMHLENLEAEEQEKEKEEQEAATAATPAATATGPRRSTQRSFRIFHDSPAPRTSVRFRSPSRIREESRPVRFAAQAPMSLEEKVDIVEEEIGAHNGHINRLRSENERVLDDLRAVLREANFSLREIANEKNSFQRDLLVLAEVNPRNKLYAEDFLRFENEKLKKKRNLRDKLQERIDLLHMEIMEAEHQFSTKKDLKDILHAVDFDQLRVLNLQLTARIRDRTSELWSLKGATKKSAGLLSESRHELQKSVEERDCIRQNIADREPQITSSQELIAVEKKQLRKLNEDYIRAIQEDDGPPQARVMEYVRLRIKAADLRRELKTWLSKVEIAERSHLQLKKHVLRQRKARLDTTPDPPRARLVTPVLVHG